MKIISLSTKLAGILSGFIRSKLMPCVILNPSSSGIMERIYHAYKLIYPDLRINQYYWDQFRELGFYFLIVFFYDID